MAQLVTRKVQFTAEQFIADPTLYDRVKQCWEGKMWLFLFGEEPVGAVLATLDDGITFKYRVAE